MITVFLWSFAYKYAEILYNKLHLDAKGLSPAQKFCNFNQTMPLKDIHTWGCPCYVLDTRLQTGKMVLSVNLGHTYWFRWISIKSQDIPCVAAIPCDF